MLTYKLIKRKYKLNDTNIADFLGYKSRVSFLTSSLHDLIVTHIERTYDQYTAGGVAAATKYVNNISFSASAPRQRRYREGLFEFIATVNSQQRKGKYRDPELGPRARMEKYKKLK